MVTSDNNSGLNELLVATANGLVPWPPPCVRGGAGEAPFTSIAAQWCGARSATRLRDGDPKHKSVQDQQHDRRKGSDQRVSDTDARGNAQEHGEHETSGGHNQTGRLK